MGKRELLLIAAFLVVGVVAYRVTAPASAEGGGFSLGALIEKIRSEVRGHNYELQATRTVTAPAPATLTTLRLDGLRGTLAIIGEDRPDISAELHASVFGADEAQARKFEQAVVVSLEPSGDDTLDLRAKVRSEEMHRGPHVKLVVRLPKRMGLRLALGGGEIEIAHVASVKFDRGSGKVMISNVAGLVSGQFGSGTFEADHVGAIELETRRAEVRLMNIGERLTLESQSGDLRVRTVGGPAELKLERIDAEVEDVAGPLTITGHSGQLRIRNVKAPVTADVERMELTMTLETAVPITASTMGDTLEVALPSGGLSIEAIAEDGQIRVSNEAITVSTAENRQRATATLRGGGPLIKLESRHGDIVLR